MKFMVLLGRILYSLIFVLASFGHFTREDIDQGAAHGVPLAVIAVPLSGIIALLGGLSIAIGYKAKFGAWLIVLFLIPVTIAFHNFWAAPADQAQMQQIMFMKNISMLGGAFLIAYFGAGPMSLDARLSDRSTRASTPERDERLAA